MAFAPMSGSKKSGLFGAPAPNYQDFSGPPDGDYARYVEGLMQWSAQEHERQRLKALGEQARSQTDSHWGRVSAKPHVITQLSAQQPGSVDSAAERWKRKAQAQAAKLQQTLPAAAKAASAGKNASAKPPIQAKGLGIMVLFAGFVLAGIFAPSLLPVFIIGWVVFNVIRAVRAASSSNKP